jgi:hypothetical protein
MLKTVIALTIATGFATAFATSSFAQNAAPAVPAVPAVKATLPASVTVDKKVEAPKAAEAVKGATAAKSESVAKNEGATAEVAKMTPPKAEAKPIQAKAHDGKADKAEVKPDAKTVPAVPVTLAK